MRLVRLTGLERDKIEDEYQKLVELITDLKDILAHQERVDQLTAMNCSTFKRSLVDERRSQDFRWGCDEF